MPLLRSWDSLSRAALQICRRYAAGSVRSGVWGKAASGRYRSRFCNVRFRRTHYSRELSSEGAGRLMSRDILTSHEGATERALTANWFVAADFLSGPGDPLLARRRHG